MIKDVIAFHAKTSRGDGIFVMPCFGEAKHTDGLILLQSEDLINAAKNGRPQGNSAITRTSN